MAHATTTDYHPWGTFMAARQEARRLGDRAIGTDHLLLGLLRDPEIESVLGVSLAEAREALATLDLNALHSIGVESIPNTPTYVDLPTPKRPSMKLVMGSRMKLSPAAKRALQEAGRPMRRRRQITPQRVLAALLESDEPDPAATLLRALGINRAELRIKLEENDPEKPV